MHSQQNFMSFLNKDKAVPSKDKDRLCCAKCRFSTKDIDLFHRHAAHHKEVTFSCALCSHVSYSKTESQKHVVSHTGSYPYRCNFCSYGAVRRDYMVKHIHRIHKRNAEKGFITNFDACGHSPATDGWPEGTEHLMNPSRASHAHVEYPSGSQTRTSTSSVAHQPVSTTVGRHPRLTYSMTSQCVTNTTPAVPFAKVQFTGAVSSGAPNTSHSLGNDLQVILRSAQENGNLSNSLVSGYSQNKMGNSKAISEKPTPKATFKRVPADTEPPLKSQKGCVPEKPIHSKTIPKVQVRLPVETNSPLRPLLNMPVGALSQRNVAVQNVQINQSAAGTNNLTAQKMNLNSTLHNNLLKHSERSSLVSMQKEESAEKRNQPKTNPRILIGSSGERASPLSNVQVELLAPLNQPIQHNKPLTVSCPDEINIPAGCLVELVEVKNVNGTRELELRLVPSNGISQDLKNTMEAPSSVASENKVSFKCQVAAGSTTSPSKSSTCQKEKQQPPLPCTYVQTARKTLPSVHKSQCSSDTAARTMNNQNLKSNGTAFRPSVPFCKGTEVCSEGLPVISSVFSLCPTPTSTKNVSQFMGEFKNSTLKTNVTSIKLQGELVSDTVNKIATTKESKQNVQSTEKSVVCNIRIKKEEETEEKPKIEDLKLKDLKKENKTVDAKAISACGQEKTVPGTTQKTLEKCSNPNTSDLKENPHRTSSLPAVMPSNRDNILDKDKGHSVEQNYCQTFLCPKVSLVRIPSSLLESNKKVPEMAPQEESVTARPVLYCTLTEQSVTGGHTGAIKLILKRDFPEDHNRDVPPRKKHKKAKTKKRKSPSAVMDIDHLASKGHELRLTPLKEDQLVKFPSPNQPVVVLNHPHPLVQMVSVGVQTLKNYKWIRSVHHMQEHTEVPASKQSSLKMKLKKVQGQKYRVIELVLRGVPEKLLS